MYNYIDSFGREKSAKSKKKRAKRKKKGDEMKKYRKTMEEMVHESIWE